MTASVNAHHAKCKSPRHRHPIEPMINLGKPHVKILSDGWTAVTRDRSLSAQFEHSVGVTQNGVEIFTLSQRRNEKPLAT
ncbi:MAG: methionyl aminopeptidase [Bradyrhizobium sp.]|nr:methionyl aminopeptidase [Bradyrhizobium sp.]